MWKLYISCNYSALEGPFNLDIDFNNWAAVFSPFSYFTHQLIRVWSFFGHWWCSPCFIRLEILINFVGNKKNCFFLLQILSRKPSFFFLKNLTDWHDESPCCHTITRSRLKLFWSLAIFILLCSPWNPYELCWKFILIDDVYLALFAMRSLKTLLEENKIVFSLNIFYFSVCLTSNKLYWIEDQLADVSTRFYTSASWRWRVEPSATWP